MTKRLQVRKKIILSSFYMLQYSVVCTVRKPYHPVHSAELVLFFCIFQGSKEERKAAWSMIKRHMRQGKMCGQGWFFSAPSPLVESQAPCLFCRLIPVKSSWSSLTSDYVWPSQTNLETKLEMNLKTNLEMKHWMNYHQKSLLQQAIAQWTLM